MCITIIDFEKQKSDIGNLSQLPDRVQKLIDRADMIVVRGFQFLNGFKDRRLIWEAGGHWTGRSASAKFIVQNIGGKVGDWIVQWKG